MAKKKKTTIGDDDFRSAPSVKNKSATKAVASKSEARDKAARSGGKPKRAQAPRDADDEETSAPVFGAGIPPQEELNSDLEKTMDVVELGKEKEPKKVDTESIQKKHEEFVAENRAKMEAAESGEYEGELQNYKMLGGRHKGEGDVYYKYEEGKTTIVPSHLPLDEMFVGQFKRVTLTKKGKVVEDEDTAEQEEDRGGPLKVHEG